jgi:D-threonate/D-erythronate kinase
VPQILILADDLSGAADCGVAFTRLGFSAMVMLSDEDEAATHVAADVLALDTDSRRLPPDVAAAINARLARRYLADDLLFYKKIDSTLRGNIAAELAALAPLAGLAIVAPASPATSRVTRGGRVFVHGVPLEATETWHREQLTGIADIAAILTRGGVRPTLVGLDLVRGEPDALRDALDRAGRNGAAAVVCDAETEADLAAIANASALLARRHFWVGSAGLAHHLARAYGFVAATPSMSLPLRGPVLVTVGSRSDVSRVQSRHLAQDTGVSTLTVPPEALLQGECSRDWQAISAGLDSALQHGADVLLTIGSADTVPLGEVSRLCAALGRLVAPFAPRLGGLVATGGDTARGVLGALGAVGLRLAREIEPGVVLSMAEGRRPLPVVTKAGAFGGPDTLVRCRAVLSGARTAKC